MDSTDSKIDIDSLRFPVHEMVGATADESISIDECSRSNTSCILRVSVGGRNGRQLFVKTAINANDDDPFWNLCVREVRFYEFISSNEFGPISYIPRPRRHSILPDNTGFYLVLDDVTDTHLSWQEVDFNDLEVWKCVIRVLADFHVTFLNNLSEKQLEKSSPNPDKVSAHIERLKDAFRRFRNDFSDGIEESVLSLLEDSIPVMDEFQTEQCQRLQMGESITITHGDLHARNIMYPKKQEDLPLLIDWQFWGAGLGVLDLRHLIGSGLPKNMRHYQMELVKFYYDMLGREVRSSYSWNECWTHYRKGIVDNLFMPVWQYTAFGWDYSRWKGTLRNAVENYYELRCDEI